MKYSDKLTGFVTRIKTVSAGYTSRTLGNFGRDKLRLGKMLYKNAKLANFQIDRQGNVLPLFYVPRFAGDEGLF